MAFGVKDLIIFSEGLKTSLMSFVISNIQYSFRFTIFLRALSQKKFGLEKRFTFNSKRIRAN